MTKYTEGYPIDSNAVASCIAALRKVLLITQYSSTSTRKEYSTIQYCMYYCCRTSSYHIFGNITDELHRYSS